MNYFKETLTVLKLKAVPCTKYMTVAQDEHTLEEPQELVLLLELERDRTKITPTVLQAFLLWLVRVKKRLSL